MTFAAALALAAVRVARGARDALLTAALAWSGIFGLIAGGYFAGRSHPQVLIDMFSPWALSLVLLTIAVRAVARRARLAAARAGRAGGAVRLRHRSSARSRRRRRRGRSSRASGTTPEVAIFEQPAATAFVREHTVPGERVAVVMALGHRIAYDTGRVNVSPYASIESMPTRQQIERTIAVLRREGGDKLFTSSTFTFPEAMAVIRGAGFEPTAQIEEERLSSIILLVDRR